MQQIRLAPAAISAATLRGYATAADDDDRAIGDIQQYWIRMTHEPGDSKAGVNGNLFARETRCN